jgi:hypothetical protein
MQKLKESIILLIGIMTATCFAGAYSDTYVTGDGQDQAALFTGISPNPPSVRGDITFGTFSLAVPTWIHGSWPHGGLNADGTPRGGANTLLDGARWISTAYSAENLPYSAQSWRLFSREIELDPFAYNISATIAITSDNAEVVYVNGTQEASDGEVFGPSIDNQEWGTVLTPSLTGFQAGTNYLEVIVKNYSGTDSPTGNPTGLIYKLTISYDLPVSVLIDIKPGSFPNAFNINGSGVIPVAILGDAGFDVHQIDVSTLDFAGLAVKVKNNGTSQCSIKDINGDGFDDLVCQFVDDPDAWAPGEGTATLYGEMLDGTPFVGADSIEVKPEIVP